MGRDKALLELGGKAAVQRVADHCTAAGLDVIVVRRKGAAALPGSLSGIEVEESREMIDSIRAGIRAMPGTTLGCLIFPVDYAMVSQASVVVVCDTLASAVEDDIIVLPLFENRPGHPIGLSAKVFADVLDPDIESLRQLIRRESARVRVVEVDDPWVRRDLDRPEDLEAARAELASRPPREA